MGSRNWKVLAGLGLAAILVLGAVATAGAGHTNVILFTGLNGQNEVPGPGDPDGFGDSFVFGIDGDTRTLCYVVIAKNIATATAAHIHEGSRSVAGPVVVSLAPPSDGTAADCLTEGEMTAAGTPVFAPGQTVADILANPGDYYINVHNAEYPAGAIRGQLKIKR